MTGDGEDSGQQVVKPEAAVNLHKTLINLQLTRKKPGSRACGRARYSGFLGVLTPYCHLADRYNHCKQLQEHHRVAVRRGQVCVRLSDSVVSLAHCSSSQARVFPVIAVQSVLLRRHPHGVPPSGGEYPFSAPSLFYSFTLFSWHFHGALCGRRVWWQPVWLGR